MAQAVVKTDFIFPKQKNVYKGKVRDVYNIDDQLLVMVVSDRISAFDVVLPEGIPYKGQVLNQIADKFLDATKDIVPNWKISVPDPMVTIGHFVETFPIEMIVRGYLTGSSWRLYKDGGREICGVPLPDGLVEHQKFPRLGAATWLHPRQSRETPKPPCACPSAACSGRSTTYSATAAAQPCRQQCPSWRPSCSCRPH